MLGTGTPLDVAKRLAAGRFSGWTYGSKASARQIDCVQFVLAVVEEVLLQTLDAPTRARVLISNLTREQSANLAGLIQVQDNAIRGVQFALTSTHRGAAVLPRDARAGDLVQYWMRKRDGTWFGHAAVLEPVVTMGGTPRARIFGAHHSSNGIATSTFELRLEGNDRRVFIVRIR